ncbi:hypothetical protein CMALT430_160042 [Carnobacterium maltaromaticum]|nr:hypothetical protein CMALT430_160042 [Carnobacterium maltaromaticum]
MFILFIFHDSILLDDKKMREDKYLTQISFQLLICGVYEDYDFNRNHH